MELRAILRAVVSLVVLVPVLPASVRAQDGPAAVRIDWATFKSAYDARSVVVVDVRGTDAFRAGAHPAGDLRAARQNGSPRRQAQKLGKPIVLYCA